MNDSKTNSAGEGIESGDVLARLDGRRKFPTLPEEYDILLVGRDGEVSGMISEAGSAECASDP